MIRKTSGFGIEMKNQEPEAKYPSVTLGFRRFPRSTRAVLLSRDRCDRVDHPECYPLRREEATLKTEGPTQDSLKRMRDIVQRAKIQAE